jgi:AAA domain/DnaB-like helicase N terminal domain
VNPNPPIPHSDESERALLGISIQQGNAEALQPVEAEDFFDSRHKATCRAFKRIHAEGKPLDLPLLPDFLTAKEIDDCGGMAYVSDIADGRAKVGNVQHHVNILKAHRARRESLYIAARISETLVQPGDATEILREVKRLAATFPDAVAKQSWRKFFKAISEMSKGEISFLIEGILPDESVVMIGGLSASFKTWFAGSMTKALTRSTRFLGNFNTPNSMPVIYLCPESGERAFRKRMELLGVNDDNFLCRTMADGAMDLPDPSLLTAVRELKPVIVLDTAIRFSKAESENSSTENANGLARDIFALRQAGARSVICIHHAPKASSGQAMTLENVLRGSGDLGAMADVVYGLQVKEQATTRILVRCVKARDFEPGRDFEIQARPYIDQQGDFAMLDSTPATFMGLDEALTANPTASFREVSSMTGISTGSVKSKTAERGWKQNGGRWERMAPWEKMFETNSVQ